MRRRQHGSHKKKVPTKPEVAKGKRTYLEEETKHSPSQSLQTTSQRGLGGSTRQKTHDAVQNLLNDRRGTILGKEGETILLKTNTNDPLGHRGRRKNEQSAWNHGKEANRFQGDSEMIHKRKKLKKIWRYKQKSEQRDTAGENFSPA